MAFCNAFVLPKNRYSIIYANTVRCLKRGESGIVNPSAFDVSVVFLCINYSYCDNKLLMFWSQSAHANQNRSYFIFRNIYSHWYDYHSLHIPLSDNFFKGYFKRLANLVQCSYCRIRFAGFQPRHVGFLEITDTGQLLSRHVPPFPDDSDIPSNQFL